MKQRGRPRQGDRSPPVIIQGAFGARPEPPDTMSPRGREIWRETTAGEPVDFFATGALRNMLADYCAHRESLERLAETINRFEPEWLTQTGGAKRYHDLLKIRDLETRASASLATKLRLTNQSRYEAKSASTASRQTLKGAKPWEE